jgi:Periplasmic copper-binding protein (NosD)
MGVRRGETRGTRGAAAVVVGLAVLAFAFVLPGSAAAHGAIGTVLTPSHGKVITVYPNGYGDTATLQAAFNSCVSYGPGCTVQLVKGTYYIGQIAVFGFQGRFVGAGQGLTTLQGLPNLPSPNPLYNTGSTPFWAGLPGPSNPWPVLITFVNGAFSMSGMTVTDSYANPTAGWTDLSSGTVTWLWAGVLVTGTEATASFDHVTVFGGAGGINIGVGSPSTFNVGNGINIEGMLLPSGWTDPLADQIALSGAFSITNSVSDYSADAVWLENLASVNAVVCFNSIDSSPEPGMADVSNSQVLFCENRVTNVADYTGFGMVQAYLKSSLLPSTVYVIGNYFAANWYGSGPSAFDYGPSVWGVPSTLNVVVSRNVVVTDNSCGCYSAATSEVLIGVGLASAVFSGNFIQGGGAGIAVNSGLGTGTITIVGNTVVGADLGIALYFANGVHVAKNFVKNSATYGIAVLETSSNATVTNNLVTGSGAYDLFWDGTGTGNAWTGNVCTTSSPPGLC